MGATSSTAIPYVTATPAPPSRTPPALTFRPAADPRLGRYAWPAACKSDEPRSIAELPAGATLTGWGLGAPATVGLSTGGGAWGFQAPDAEGRIWGAAPGEHWARTGSQRWLQLLAHDPEAGSTMRSLELYISEADNPALGTAYALDAGDDLTIVGPTCFAEQCMALTSPTGKVKRPGGDLWIFTPTATDAIRVSIEPGDAGAMFPVGISSGPGGFLGVFERQDELAIFALTASGAEAFATVPREAGVLATGPVPGALIYRQSPSEECTHAPGIRWVYGPDKAVDLPSPVNPLSAHIVRLGAGAAITWLSPLRCEDGAPSQRRIVYMQLVNSSGAPVGEATAMADARKYAVASDGDRLHLWVESAESPSEAGGLASDPVPSGAVHWAQASCSLGS